MAFEDTGIDPAWYAHRERPADEVFPWAHLGSGPPADYLRREYDDVFVEIGANQPPSL